MQEFDAELTKDIIFPNEKELYKSPEELFSDKLKQEIMYTQMKNLCKVNPELEEPLSQRIIFDELAEFIREHILAVGKEQAIKDFQTGLNLLTGYKKETVLEEQVRLEEDADFGGKTFDMLKSALEYYPLEVIKEYIKTGASNNAVWETKDDTKIDTNEFVEEITNNLTEGEI